MREVLKTESWYNTHETIGKCYSNECDGTICNGFPGFFHLGLITLSCEELICNIEWRTDDYDRENNLQEHWLNECQYRYKSGSISFENTPIRYSSSESDVRSTDSKYLMCREQQWDEDEKNSLHSILEKIIEFEIGNEVHSTICESRNQEPDECIDHSISGFFEFFFFTCCKYHLNSTPCDCEDCEDSRKSNKPSNDRSNSITSSLIVDSR